jgi:CbiX protein
MFNVRLILAAAVAAVLTQGTAHAEGPGILLLAHGGSAQWNAHVTRLAAEVDRTKPTEVAFGMATRANIQAAIDKLKARGATEIVAVPLFVSSWSSVVTSTEYLLGQRKEAPKELAIYAKMSHGSHGAAGASAGGGSHASHGTAAGAQGTAGAHDSHAGHDAAKPVDGSTPVETSLPVRMTPALNDHPVVAEILTTRARSISRSSADEAVVIVAHGPVADEENRKWLADMGALAQRVGKDGQFASVDYLTLRDDAPKPVRDAATAELREIVTKRLGEQRRVLIVPLLISFGGIERGLRERLEGLTYSMPDSGLVPDDRLVAWVLAMAAR